MEEREYKNIQELERELRMLRYMMQNSKVECIKDDIMEEMRLVCQILGKKRDKNED